MKGFGRNTVEDFAHGMPPRAFGTEVEFTHPAHIKSFVSQQNLSRKLVRYIDPQYLVSSGRDERISAVISTGGELYLDSTVEYATPECRNPQELVLHERAGEQITIDTIDRIAVAARFPRQDISKRSGYPDMTVGDKKFVESTIGYHENYTSMNVFSPIVSPKERTDAMRQDVNARCLSDFLVLRKLIDGAGMVADGHYSLTQKPKRVNYTYYQPNPNNEHWGQEPFRVHGCRLEIRSGENSKSDWATEFTVGLTSLVVRLVEHDKYPQHLLLNEPNVALHALARDPLSYVKLESGVQMKAVDILRDIVDEAYQLGRNYDEFPEFEERAALDFLKFYDDLHKISLPDNDTKALADRINWAGRYDYFNRRGITHDSFQNVTYEMVRQDLAWDRLGDRDIARIYFSKLGETALKVDIPGPPETRARPRVEIAGRLYREGMLDKVEWHQVRVYATDHYLLGGPLNTEPILESELEKLKKSA